MSIENQINAFIEYAANSVDCDKRSSIFDNNKTAFSNKGMQAQFLGYCLARCEFMGKLENLEERLKKAGAKIPIENKGTTESAIETGLSIAMLEIQLLRNSIKNGDL